MLFPRAAVVGIGLIGGSFALAAREAGLVGHVTGVARSEATRRGALDIGAADEATADAAEAVARADLVYLAAPVKSICEALGTLGPHLQPGALVTDAGSAKVAIVEAAQALPAEVTFIGGHPMAGSEQAGIAAARADLFAGCNYFLTPEAQTRPEALKKLENLISGLGAQPMVVDAARHDRLVAITSHLPHLLAWALCAVAGESGDPAELAPFVAGAWRDTTRIAGSSPELWAEIFRANAGNLAALVERFAEELREAEEALAGGAGGRLVELLAAAREIRERIAES